MLANLLTLALIALDPGITALQSADARVGTIAYRLQTANVALCSDVEPLAGFEVQTIAQYQPDVRAAVTAQTGIGRQPNVKVIIADGAADRAGLKIGDTLTAINGTPTPDDLPVRASYASLAKAQHMIDDALKKPPIILSIIRGASEHTIEISGIPGCASRVEVATGKGLRARADGSLVQISSTLVDFAENDNELAAIVAHELSHNILHHHLRFATEKVSRGVFAGLGKNGEELRKSEYEADRLGVWLVARAGYDITAIEPLWSRLGRHMGHTTILGSTHPDWKDRTAQVSAAVAEIRSQRAAALPLIPTKLSLSGSRQRSNCTPLDGRICL
jgi:Zn-dependent protease with chaperone function